MSTGFERPDGFPPPGKDTALGAVAGWFLGLVGLNPQGLGAFAGQLAAVFRPGFPVTQPAAGTWFATLDAVDPEDNQVAALVRLSRHKPSDPRPDPRRGMVDVEEEERELVVQTEPAGPPAGADLVLTYSFPLLFPLDRNLELFREFAGNELGRLRADPAAKG